MDQPDDFMIGALLGMTVGALNHVAPETAQENEAAFMRLLSMPPEQRNTEAAILMKALEWDETADDVSDQGVQELIAWGLLLRDL
ncbi:MULTISPECIES: hypothetical protein [unclassified Luteococcus]|uniref:hypothetical protein n=1 Tax=unclassified Luteococcus TaxID=2639923 RepID=UPI00313BFCFF